MLLLPCAGKKQTWNSQALGEKTPTENKKPSLSTEEGKTLALQDPISSGGDSRQELTTDHPDYIPLPTTLGGRKNIV